MVAGTWLGAFGALIPTWRGAWGQFGLDQIIGSCSILRDENRKYQNLYTYMNVLEILKYMKSGKNMCRYIWIYGWI